MPNRQVVALHQPHRRVWVLPQRAGLDSLQHADVHVSGLEDNWREPTEAQQRKKRDRPQNLLSRLERSTTFLPAGEVTGFLLSS